MPTAHISDIIPDDQPVNDKHDYASTQFNLPDPISKIIKLFSSKIPDKILVEKGREDEPHVTVLYGLHNDDPKAVEALLNGETPISVNLASRMSLFSNPDCDVLKIDITSPDLEKLHKKLLALPNSNEYPEYRPHATIAYLAPGMGVRYARQPLPGVTGKNSVLGFLTFSAKDGQKTTLPLTAQTKTEEEEPLHVVESKQSGGGLAGSPDVSGGSPDTK